MRKNELLGVMVCDDGKLHLTGNSRGVCKVVSGHVIDDKCFRLEFCTGYYGAYKANPAVPVVVIHNDLYIVDNASEKMLRSWEKSFQC